MTDGKGLGVTNDPQLLAMMRHQFQGRAGVRERSGYPRAVVTGGSSGIGAAVVQLLGARFQILDLSRAAGVDITDPVGVRAALEGFGEQHGSPEVLVNCAGLAEPEAFTDITVSSWRRQIDVNLTGTFIACSEFVRIAAVPAVIVNVASTSALRPSPGWAAYAAAKAAVVSLSTSMAAELGPAGVRVYCIAPGRCATPLRRALAPDEDQDQIMQPAEVAAVIAQLLAEPAMLTGQVITVRRPGG